MTLQGRSPSPSSAWIISARLILTLQGSRTPAFDQTVTTDNLGRIRLTGLNPGVYHLWLKGSHTLAVAQDVVIVSGANSVITSILPEGDVNGDNVVNLTDFSILAASFDKQEGSEGYDGRADFNGDGVVNLTDFSLLATNFGQTGDE